ncbi:UPF0739 protein C1orf74 homolog [Paramacrobiotus metropolitanus]|uniref:UPF0739 protein C1orf74 homolog n=1 Tax=Paramacrobiotus metropolitanus TaxID=2943436 RepID=UPI002445B37E|nr:UPF0739 protein C1orf74 homolog [Paramacrobiotus metropolitanus]
MFEAEEEQGQFENDLIPIQERILNILGPSFAKRAGEIAFEVERLRDSKPAVIIDGGDVSFEKLERFAPSGLNVVEIAGRKLLINLEILDVRMPWGSHVTTRRLRPPIFVDISPGLSKPRLMNPQDLPNSSPDVVANSHLFFMTLDITDMMRDIRGMVAMGERVIEKRNQWSRQWCVPTVYGCLLGYPVVLWSNSEEANYCLQKDTKVWKIEWIDGECRRPLYSFFVPDVVMNSSLKIHIQQWTDRIFDRNLPHQNYYMLQTLQTFETVIL